MTNDAHTHTHTHPHTHAHTYTPPHTHTHTRTHTHSLELFSSLSHIDGKPFLQIYSNAAIRPQNRFWVHHPDVLISSNPRVTSKWMSELMREICWLLSAWVKRKSLESVPSPPIRPSGTHQSGATVGTEGLSEARGNLRRDDGFLYHSGTKAILPNLPSELTASTGRV